MSLDECTCPIDYREAYYGTEKPDFIAKATEDREWANLAWSDRLEAFERHTAGRRILDIGCGPGFFLKCAQDRGWRCHGVDPSRQACAHARSLGLSVTEDYFGPGLSLGRFGVVHMNNVLEHVEDPENFLRQAVSLVNAGGLICVSVPNDNTPFQRAAAKMRDLPNWWLSPHHKSYFDFASLTSLVEKLGCTVLGRTTSFPMEMFILMGLDYVRSETLGKYCHTRRKSFDMALDNETRRRFYRALADAGFGREAVITARVKT